MKFCYLDESGTGNEPYAIMTGIVVDAARMHVTKYDWAILLSSLSSICKRKINEFHATDFYCGNSPWRNLNGAQRSAIISAIFEWLSDRKHRITFSGIDKALFLKEKKDNKKLEVFHSIWCFLGLHQILTIQKAFQSYPKNKGNTVLIFDNEVREQTHFAKLISSPPSWIYTYYCESGNPKNPLDQIIDVPYYGDSKEVHLIQIADLVSYLLRRYVEIFEGKSQPKYADERQKLETWIKEISKLSLPRSTRYPAVGRDESSDLFFRLSPASLRVLGKN